jgi:hypothetical protein
LGFVWPSCFQMAALYRRGSNLEVVKIKGTLVGCTTLSLLFVLNLYSIVINNLKIFIYILAHVVSLGHYVPKIKSNFKVLFHLLNYIISLKKYLGFFTIISLITNLRGSMKNLTTNFNR